MGEKYPKLQDKCFSYFKDRIYENGVETLKLSSWKDFHKVAEIFNKYQDYYIWRGQRKDWQFKSKIDRDPYANKLNSLFGKRENILNALLEKFKNQLQDLNPQPCKINFSDEDKIWAIGQHYGLPTPLLDWTEDHYIAAYFAFNEKSTNENCNRVVYALNIAIKTSLRILKIKIGKDVISRKKDRFIKLIDLKKDPFIREDRRINAQKGIFTKALNGIDIEKIVYGYPRKTDIVKNKKILLVKIFIPDEFQKECLDNLKSMKNKITRGSLFPDYSGAVEICITDLGLDI